MTVSTPTRPPLTDVAGLARLLRRDSIRATHTAGSGHPTSALSAADLAAVLFARYFRFDAHGAERADNDRFVLSKGHAAPLLYAVLAAFGLIDPERQLELRRSGSTLEGHPVPGLPLVDVATGSLGQGLSNGLGLALGQRIRDFDARTWVMLGDSEMAEGSVWEAVELAGHMQVANLTAVVDLNRLGQRGPTMHEWEATPHLRRAEACGWAAIEIDGHDLEAIDTAYAAALESERPVMIVARTLKGKGVSFAEDSPNRHGKPFDDEETEQALEELGTVDERRWEFSGSPHGESPQFPSEGRFDTPTFDADTPTRDAFGTAIAARAASDPRLVVIDAEVGDSTRSGYASEELADRFIQAFIAEQNMVGMAAGLQAIGFHPVVATFGAFLTRAHDFLRMAHIGGANLTAVGSHAGVSIGEDGPSQMALDDLSMMRGVGATVFYPADAVATVALLDLALAQEGMTYLRTTRGATPLLYGPDTEFELGGSHVHYPDGRDVTIAGAGVTLFEALEAARRLADDGIDARVVDVYSLDPVDESTLRKAVRETDLIVTVEDHRRPGGLGETVAGVVSSPGVGRVISLTVDGMPGSASEEEQRRLAGIDARAIEECVRANLHKG